MSRLEDFAISCRAHPGRTLSDQLVIFKMEDPAQRASLRAQMRRALAKDGRYRELAENSIIIPGPEDRGEWADGLDRAENKLPVTLKSIAFTELRNTDKGRLPSRYREHMELAQQTNITGRKGVMINNALVVGINEFERKEDQVEALMQLLHQKDAIIEQLTKDVEFLREIIRSLGGNGLVPAAA